MNNLSYHFLVIWLFVILNGSFPLPIAIQEKKKLQEESPSNIFIPESNVFEESSEEPPVFIMVPVLGERLRRGIYEDGNMVNFDNVSYEVPTFIKFNESAKGDIEVSLVPSPDLQSRQIGTGGAIGTGNGGPNNNCCPPAPPKPNFLALTAPQPPLCLTIAVDNAFPPGKASKFVISNSSEIRGTGAILKISFIETKTTVCPSDLFVNFDSTSPKERLESQKKKKVEDEEEEEDEGGTTQVIDQKVLQDIILKILAGNKTSGTTQPPEEVLFIEHSTTDPSFTFVINPSLYHKISGKYGTIATTRRSSTYKSLNPPDFDSLLKTVEHLTSTMSKDKLLSLLSNLINKATFTKEVPSNQ